MIELEARHESVVPELAVLLTPFNMAISGKAPIDEDSDTGTAAVAAHEPGSTTAQATNKLHPIMRQWRPAFNPTFTITGTQPSLLLPQVSTSRTGSCCSFITQDAVYIAVVTAHYVSAACVIVSTPYPAMTSACLSSVLPVFGGVLTVMGDLLSPLHASYDQLVMPEFAPLVT